VGEKKNIYILVHGIPRAFYNIYKKIREDHFLRNTKIMFVVENNYGHICNQIAGTIENDSRFERYFFLRQKSDVPGFHTLEQDSYMNRKFLQQNVALGNIVLAHNLITCNTDMSFSHMKVLSMFKNQLNGLYEFPKRELKRGPLRNRISSIVDRDGKDKYLNDDIEMAFSIGCAAMLAFFSKSLPIDYMAIDNLPAVTMRVQPFIDTNQLSDQIFNDINNNNNSYKNKRTKKMKFTENNGNGNGNGDNNKHVKFISDKDRTEKNEWLEDFMSKDYEEIPDENLNNPEDMQKISNSHFINLNVFNSIKV
jgi:hypothetical protein